MSTFAEDAEAAMIAHPRYFLWWYTIKSVALCGAVAACAYLYGRRR